LTSEIKHIYSHNVQVTRAPWRYSAKKYKLHGKIIIMSGRPGHVMVLETGRLADVLSHGGL